MKVATRITMATAVVVALASVSYAFFDMRSRRDERRLALDREARAMAAALRFELEAQPSIFRAMTETALRDLSRAAGGWRVTVRPSGRAQAPVAADGTAAQLRRLNAMILVPRPGTDIEAGQYYYDLPIRGTNDRRGEPEVIGMLEISKSADVLDATAEDLQRVVTLVLL